jgi:hypothetical protein
VDYEERITCFIDLLGFKAAIEQTLEQSEIKTELYKIIHDLDPDRLLDFVQGEIPYISPTEAGTITTAPVKTVWSNDHELKKKIRKSFPLTITQFSDSFVISCPADNSSSCSLLLTTVYLINQMFFLNIGMMMRGGVSKGLLIHEENGALFGPSMIEAYELESKLAIYPRIIISPSANQHLSNLLGSQNFLQPIKTSFDGHAVIDLISIFSWDRCNFINQNDIETQLKAIEKDILKNSPSAHPKIAYLLDQWKLRSI